MNKPTFKFESTGACLITPFAAPDKRGEFTKDFNSELFRKNGINFTVHEILNVTSKKGVLRCIHFQVLNSQAKVVRCLRGAIIDVIVDLRRHSPTFGKWFAYELTAENKQMLYVPHGFAHGYLVLEDDTQVEYFCDDTYNPDYDTGLHYLDPDVNIDWPWDRIGSEENVIVSDKDEELPTLQQLHDADLSSFVGYFDYFGFEVTHGRKDV